MAETVGPVEDRDTSKLLPVEVVTLISSITPMLATIFFHPKVGLNTNHPTKTKNHRDTSNRHDAIHSQKGALEG